MRYHFLLLIFIISCSNPRHTQTSDLSPYKPSVLAEKFSNLVERALKLGVSDFFQDSSPKIDRIHSERLGAFIAELRVDQTGQNNLILLKNEFLSLAESNFQLKPIEQADFFEKTANNPKALEVLIHIRNDLYGPDGKLLKKILLGAANDPVKRKVFLAAQGLGNCIKKYPNKADWWRCVTADPVQVKTVFSDDQYGFDLLKFSQSELKKHLDAFSEITGDQGRMIEGEFIWASIRLINFTDYASLGWAHRTVRDLTQENLREHLLAAAAYLKASNQGKLNQLVSDLMPELREFAHALVESVTGKSWANLGQKDLQTLLDQLGDFLTKYFPGKPEQEPQFASEPPPQDSAEHDMFDRFYDLREKATSMVTKTHVHKLSAFVEELLKDPESEKNLIEVKNAFLNSPPQVQSWSADWIAHLLDTVAYDENAVSILLKIRDGLYGPDGQLLKKILLAAANSASDQTAFLAGQAYNKCVKEYGWYRCHPTGLYWETFRHYAWIKNSDKIRFSKTQLSANLQAFLKIIKQEGELREEDTLVWASIKLLPILSYSSLDWFHQYIQQVDPENLKEDLHSLAKYLRDSRPEQVEAMLSEFGPHMHEGHALFESFTGKSLRGLDVPALHSLLEKLDAFLINEEYGLISYISGS